MSYYKQLQIAIDYIEDNLNEKISHSDLSKVSGYSVPHFYRIFGAMIGYSVMEYVRRRKLSNALYELMTTTNNILEIALNNGYDSHEGFSRVFKTVYGAPPSHFRNVQVEVKLFEHINLIKRDKGGYFKMMKPEIIFKERIYLIGKKTYVTGPEKEKFALFRKTREALMESVYQISFRKDRKYIAAYDLDFSELDKSHDDMNYTYYYCVEVGEITDIPIGMVTKTLEPSKYAVFKYDKAAKTLNNEKIDRPVYDYINGIWLPESGYELADLQDYELIDHENDTVDYYIAIK